MPKRNTESLRDERLELLFRHAGLTDKQAKLYRILLTDGDARVTTLAAKSGIKRSTVYILLRDLATHGLVTEFDKGKISYFRPESPARIHDLIASREKEISVAKELAGDMLPKLTTQWKSAVNRPVVTYVEGPEGLKTALEDIYAPGKAELIGCVAMDQPDEEIYTHIIKKCMPLRIRRNIFARAINTDNPKSRELQKQDAEHLREIFLVDGQEYPLPAEIDIYNDKIAMLSFEKGDMVGLIIENRAFAKTLESVFRLLYRLLRTPQPKTDAVPPVGPDRFA